MSLCLRGRLNPVLWSFDSNWWVATHGLRAVCGASAQFVMVSNHGISVPFVIHVLVGFMLPFVIGLPPLWFVDFLRWFLDFVFHQFSWFPLISFINICALVNLCVIDFCDWYWYNRQYLWFGERNKEYDIPFDPWEGFCDIDLSLVDFQLLIYHSLALWLLCV